MTPKVVTTFTISGNFPLWTINKRS
jgi:hypothetical protein